MNDKIQVISKYALEGLNAQALKETALAAKQTLESGSGLLLVPLGCSLFGISNDVAMQIVGVGFIVSVIQDSLETALNSSGDVIFTATAEFLEWKKQGKELPL